MAWIYLALIFSVVILLFIIGKRPMYEVMFLALVVLLIVSGRWQHFMTYMTETVGSYLLFTMAMFIIFGTIVEKTGIVTDILDVIAALAGRFTGGAGYVTLIAGAAMSSVCGSGTGTVAAAGTFMIPAMKKTGFSPELAATTTAAAGTLGPLIPPSAAIPVMYSMLVAVFPGYCTASQFWMLAWPVCFWLFIQRLITLYVLIRKNNVQPIPPEDRMPLKKALKKGWRTLLLPVLMAALFVFDNIFKDTLIADRLGSYGAETFSQVVLVTVPCIACVFVLLLWLGKGNKLSVKEGYRMVSAGVTVVAPIIMMTFSGFAMGSLLNDLELASQISAQFAAWGISKWGVIIVAPLIFTLLGMFMESSAVYFLLGPVFIPIAISVGIDPMLAAMMVNVLANGMGQMSPPFALCLLLSMGIAESDFKKTSVQAAGWCAAQYIAVVLMLGGMLPMFGFLK
ncbi:MAG: TRAP transporter large permease subunit [Eubacterium sp.]|nr:TRAP transporter large permease subunit [Eubacterium sp.]